MKLFLWQRQCLINNLKPLIPGNWEGRWGLDPLSREVGAGPPLKGGGGPGPSLNGGGD